MDSTDVKRLAKIFFSGNAPFMEYLNSDPDKIYEGVLVLFFVEPNRLIDFMVSITNVHSDIQKYYDGLRCAMQFSERSYNYILHFSILAFLADTKSREAKRQRDEIVWKKIKDFAIGKINDLV